MCYPLRQEERVGTELKNLRSCNSTEEDGDDGYPATNFNETPLMQ